MDFIGIMHGGLAVSTSLPRNSRAGGSSGLQGFPPGASVSSSSPKTRMNE